MGWWFLQRGELTSCKSSGPEVFRNWRLLLGKLVHVLTPCNPLSPPLTSLSPPPPTVKDADAKISAPKTILIGLGSSPLPDRYNFVTLCLVITIWWIGSLSDPAIINKVVEKLNRDALTSVWSLKFAPSLVQGLYDIHIKLQGVPLLGWEAPSMAVGLNVR